MIDATHGETKYQGESAKKGISVALEGSIIKLIKLSTTAASEVLANKQIRTMTLIVLFYAFILEILNTK
jgi:hypothetical protein